MKQLKKHLHVDELYLENDVFVMHWNIIGRVTANHRINCDYEMNRRRALTNIAQLMLDDQLTVHQALRMIAITERPKNGIERFYRRFPGRTWVFPLMAFSGTSVFFDGTWYDLGFSAASGIIVGLVTWTGT